MTPVSEAIETYLYSVASLSGNTFVSYRDKLRVFQQFCESGDISLEQITPKVFRAFLDHISERMNPQTGVPVSGFTISSYARVIKVFLTWVSTYEDYLGAIRPGTLKAMRVPSLEKKFKPTFTVREVHALYEACKRERTKYLIDRDRSIVTLLLDTGIRASELCSLKIGDVHLSPEDSYIRVHGKGDKWREVGLGKQARIDLNRYLKAHRKGAAPESLVFLNRMRKPLTRNGLDQILYRLKEWAGIKTRGGVHMFRHTFATQYIDNGGDVYDLRDLMGHEHVSTTEIYTRGTSQKRARKARGSVWDNL